VAEADAAGRALDQSRQVGEDERRVSAEGDQAEVRVLGRERVVGNFWPRPRQPRQERALAGVRLAHQADVGDDLQLQNYVPPLAFATGRALARGAIGGGLEGRIPFAPSPSHCRDHLFTRFN
jgi:hypothetical protein